MVDAAPQQALDRIVERVALGESLTDASVAIGRSGAFASNHARGHPEFAKRLKDARATYMAGLVTDDPKVVPQRERDLERQLETATTAKALAERAAHLLKADLAEAREEVGRLETEQHLAARAAQMPAPAWLATPAEDKKHHGTLVAGLFDTHYGERVRPEEMNRYNAYDMAIAEKRTRRFFERTILVSRTYLNNVEYDGIVVPLGGDIVSGDIHEELAETNELSTYETIIQVVPWLRAGLEMFLEEYGKVHVVSAPGNHGRNSRKPRYKRRSANNADTFIARILAQHFDGVKGITFDVPATMTADFKVYDVGFRLEHGDEAKGGTGIQGALAPLMLRVHRIRKQAQAEGHPLDILLLGHWHQQISMPSKGLVVSGSMKGYDEYARGKGFEPEPPQQSLLVVTPEHGITTQSPIFVSKRSDEGW